MPRPDDNATPRLKRALIGLAVVGALYVASLPWQRAQWADAEKSRETARRAQAQIQRIQQGNEVAQNAEAILKSPENQSPDALLDALDATPGTLDPPKTDRLLRAIESRDGTDATRLARIASVYQAIGYYDRAWTLARRAAETTPAPTAALLRLGYLEILFGETSSTLARFELAAKQDPNSPEPLVGIALFRSEARQYDLAETALKQAQKLSPKNPRLFLLRAQNFNGARRYEDTLRVLDEAESEIPNDPDLSAQRAFLQIEKARRASGADAGALLADAQGRCDAILALSPDNAAILAMLASIAEQRKDDDAVLQLREKAFAIDPNYGSLRTILGRTYARRGDRKKGEALIREGQRLQSESDAFNKLINQRSGAPTDPEKRRALARFCTEHGKIGRALREWDRLLELKPGDPEAVATSEKLRRRRGDG